MRRRSIGYMKPKKYLLVIGNNEKEENTVTITATPNGPFIVEGRFKLVDREGKAEMKENRTALCRCGRSYKQPFCDGTHRKIHYNDLSLKKIEKSI